MLDTPASDTADTSDLTVHAYAWDDKPLRFICRNAKLPGQVYVRADGLDEMAFRGGSHGSRMSLAPLIEPPDDAGIDYAKDALQFVLGPVYLPSDDALFAAAEAQPGVEISASPRNASALVIVPLATPAPSAPVGDAPAAPAPRPVALTPEETTHARSLVRVIEAKAIAGVHAAESEVGKAWHELLHLLHR